jgi:hypothetical protein
MPSYLYGFAAGKFTQTQESAGDTSLQYFGPSSLFTSASLQQVFADSADMLVFYAERAGVSERRDVLERLKALHPKILGQWVVLR